MNSIGEFLPGIWPHILTVATLAIDVVATCHAILYKRDTRAAIAWVGFIWFVPIIGSLLYIWLGINRIQRRAKSIREGSRLPREAMDEFCVEAVNESVRKLGANLSHLAQLVGDVTGLPLLAGNKVVPLTGETAYPEMLQAIEAAERSVSLTTYIFDNDDAGRRFLQCLARAITRNVQVRVIVDDVGAKYSWPSMTRSLRRAGIPVVAFMPKLAPWAFPYANLRNHRKILVVDGRIAFTGGMNIRIGHVSNVHVAPAIDDLHFRVEGPVVAQLQHTFAEDWFFCREEKLEGESWFPKLTPVGPILARGISSGPDEDFESLRTTILCGLACATSSVRVVTPYFLPDAALITALNLAAMRGVDVDILLPSQSNLKLVQWASTALLWQILERGCRVWLTPPPFDHSKLMIVDGAWTLLGSSNWDPRSLRLNFEFNVECYDSQLAACLEALIQGKLAKSSQITLADVDGRSLLRRLRDGGARLLSPYL